MQYGATPLVYAAVEGYTGTVRTLIRNRAQIDCNDKVTFIGYCHYVYPYFFERDLCEVKIHFAF